MGEFNRRPQVLERKVFRKVPQTKVLVCQINRIRTIVYGDLELFKIAGRCQELYFPVAFAECCSGCASHGYGLPAEVYG